MLATAGALPPAQQEDRWAYEMKWDGIRAVLYLGGDRPRVFTRNDRDVSASYPELQALGDPPGSSRLVLDGEIVAFDPAGRPDFGVLQQRMHVQRPSPALVTLVPVHYFVFDVLWSEGRSLLNVPYAQRRILLDGLDLRGPSWDTPPVFLGLGTEALAASSAGGLEGVVAKRIDSVYEPGRRSSAWIKIKHIRMQDVVVGGWRPGQGRREGGIGSLLLGVHGDRGLEYAGHVGTGFTAQALDQLGALLMPLRRTTSPFAVELPRADSRDAVWVQPTLVGEVAFTEWTKDDRLRHPSWRGLRPDRDAADVTREA